MNLIDIGTRAGFPLDDARLVLETQDARLLAHEEPRDPARSEPPAMRSWNRLDDRGLENLAVTQRHQLRAVILTAAQRSIERHLALPLDDRNSQDSTG